MKTVICFLLDETGSMQPFIDATMSGFNEYVNKFRDQKDVTFKLTKFNSAKVDIQPSVSIKDAPVLSRDNYKPDNLTPLYDAIGRTIKDVEAEVGSKKRKVLFVIMTDGQENSSLEYSRDAIFRLIQEKEKSGWTFTYLGANQDSWAVGATLGIQKGNTANYNQAQTREAFEQVTCGTFRYLSNTDAQVRDFYGGSK
jgi:hypothetical protein